MPPGGSERRSPIGGVYRGEVAMRRERVGRGGCWADVFEVALYECFRVLGVRVSVCGYFVAVAEGWGRRVVRAAVGPRAGATV